MKNLAIVDSAFVNTSLRQRECYQHTFCPTMFLTSSPSQVFGFQATTVTNIEPSHP
jgi:hypothetical protein